MSSQSNLV